MQYLMKGNELKGETRIALISSPSRVRTRRKIVLEENRNILAKLFQNIPKLFQVLWMSPPRKKYVEDRVVLIILWINSIDMIYEQLQTR